MIPRGSVTTTYSRLILGDEGWKPLTTCLNFGISNGLKLHTIYFVISEQIKPLQLVGQAAEFKFETKVEPLLVIWQSGETNKSQNKLCGV